MEKYETIEELGKGTFAVVVKAKEINTGEIVAIKKLKKKYTTWNECIELREVKSLDILKKHENIIKLKEMIRVEDNLHLVFEYMEKNLYEMMMQKQIKKFSESQIRSIMWQTLQGIAYMHKYGFFHRDLKPENLLVSGEVIKLADFGLAREIRSLPPYTDYIATRYYRAPECILKSTNYNSPIDIWALGCIMAELFTYTPIFLGNTEKEVLFRMCSILGTPTNTTWAEGIQLAKKIDLKFPVCPGVALSQMIPDGSRDALDIISEMLKWDPNKRPTASALLQHPFFTQYPILTRLTTPDRNSEFKKTNKTFKTYSNVVNNKKKKEVTELDTVNNDMTYTLKTEHDDFSKILDDTRGFNEFIKKIKDEKYEEEMKFLENNKLVNPSPIAKKVDEEFDFSEIDRYLKENNNSNNTLYSNLNVTNSLLNANIFNYTGLASTLTTNLNIKNQAQTIYNYKDGTFFDTTTINSINGKVNNNSSTGNGSFGSSNNLLIAHIDDKEIVESPTDKESFSIRESEFYQSRRKNFGINKIESIENNINPVTSTTEEVKPNEIIPIKKRQQGKSSTELDFDNCNVYLKHKNENSNPSITRKGSAFKFIEEKMKNNSNNNPAQTVKSTKDALTDKLPSSNSSTIPNSSFHNPTTNLNLHFMNSNTIGGNPINASNKIPHKNNSNPNVLNPQPSIKNPVIPHNTINIQQNDKKSEFQSRRKNIANIINELDGKVIDINLNSTANNKSEIDKNDHHVNLGRKNVNCFGNNVKSEKDMVIAEGSYNKKINQSGNLGNGANLSNMNTINNINNTFAQNLTNNSILNNESGVTINFASRRLNNNQAINNSGVNNNLQANHSIQNITSRHLLNKENNNINSINSDKIRFY